MGPPLRLRGGSLGDLWFDVWRFFWFDVTGELYGVQGLRDQSSSSLGKSIGSRVGLGETVAVETG